MILIVNYTRQNEKNELLKTFILIESRFIAKPSIFKDAYASSNEVATSSKGFCGNRSKHINQMSFNEDFTLTNYYFLFYKIFKEDFYEQKATSDLNRFFYSNSNFNIL